MAAKCKLVSKVSIETACHFCELGIKDGVHYGTVVMSYSTVPEPQLARLLIDGSAQPYVAAAYISQSFL